MSKTEEKTEEVVKNPVSILGKDGKYAPLSLTEINRQAHGSLMGRKKRIQAAQKAVNAILSQAIKRS